MCPDNPPAGGHPAGLTANRCPACAAALSLHQPDPDRPDRLLAVCDRCGGWFLLDGTTGASPRSW